MIKVEKITKDNLKKFFRFTGVIPFCSDSLWVGASISDLPCGVLLANKEKNGICEAEFLFVHPSVRRMRIASKMLDLLIEKSNDLVNNSCIKTTFKTVKADVTKKEETKKVYKWSKEETLEGWERTGKTKEILGKEVCE